MKRTVLFALMLLVAAFATAQEYVVKGKAPIDSKTILLQKLFEQKNETVAVDSTGHFTFKGKTPKDAMALVLDMDKRTFLPLLLEGNVTVDLVNKSVSGNEENQLLSIWFAKYDSLQNAMSQAHKVLSSTESNDSIRQIAQKEYESLSKTATDMLMDCFNQNIDKKFPAFFLAQFYSMLPKDEILALAERQPIFLETPLMAPIKKSVAGWQKQAIGQLYTDFEMTDTLGTKRHLSEFVENGKYVLIDFWASWCGPCRAEMPAVKALYDKYHSKGFDIVGVSFDNKKTAWTGAIRKMQLNWNHISDLKGWQNAAAAIYGIYSIPATLLIGPDGKIIASGLDSNKLGKKLEEIFPN